MTTVQRFAVLTALASAQLALAQEIMIHKAEPALHEFRSNQFAFISGEMIGPEQNVAGMPYSADQTTTTTQMLADGNRIVNTSSAKVYRDTQGRTRVERTLANIGSLPAGQAKVLISISDPVAGARYELDPDSRTATKVPEMVTLANMAAQKVAPAEAKARVRSETIVKDSNVFYTSTGAGGFVYTTTRGDHNNAKTDDLGTQVMEGVQVKGTRNTTVIPANSIGNDRDITMVNERWYSPELKMNIMTKHSDPRMGETVFQVTNLSRANPDASLFQIPSDYQVKENQNQKFTVRTREE